MLATLGLGVYMFEDNAGVANLNSPITQVEVNQPFWVQVVVEDQRTTGAPQGVTALPLNLSWDPQQLQLLNPPTQFTPTNLSVGNVLLTGDFPSQRLVDTFDDTTAGVGHDNFMDPLTVPVNPNVVNLGGASLPRAAGGVAIGVEEAGLFRGGFSLLRFQAAGAPATDTPFTMQLAGAMSFADGDPLDTQDPVNVLSAARLQDRQPPNGRAPVDNDENLAVTEFLTIVAAPAATPSSGSLAGTVYLDKNANGVFDGGELGVPNVLVSLTGTTDTGASVSRATATGADGSYLFQNLAPGTYRIAETQPNPTAFIDAAESLGRLVAPVGTAITGSPGAIVGNDVFAGIRLAQGPQGTVEQGIEYNFGELFRPTKRMFLASTDPFQEVCRGVGLQCATVRGTDAMDQITVRPNDSVTIQTAGLPPQQPLSIAAFDAVLIDGGGGDDVVTVEGTAGNEVICLAPGKASVRRGDDYLGDNYGVATVNAEQVIVSAGGGQDVAVVQDTAAADQLTAGNGGVVGQGTVEIRSNGLLGRAVGFDEVRAISVRGGNDTATILPPLQFDLLLLGAWL